MLVAVTADLHLTSRKIHPERFHTLEDILKQMIKGKIQHLIVAGDLFDQEERNFDEFDALCKEPKHRSIHFHVVPGNHDQRLSAKTFTAENVTLYSQPEIKDLDLLSLSILFMPYQKDKNMGEALAAFQAQCRPSQWILIGHGDWTGTLKEPNPAEPGLYMPVTRVDVETLKPAAVILGHVHKPIDQAIVHVPGSPCGLDITETGRRRYLLLDTETGGVKSVGVNTDVLFFDENLVVIPADDEEKLIRTGLEAMVRGWGLSEFEKSKAVLRLRVAGYTSDKARLAKVLSAFFKGIRMVPEGEPDFSGLSVSDDVERADLAERVRKRIDSMSWPQESDAPTRDEAFIQALRVIYEA